MNYLELAQAQIEKRAALLDKMSPKFSDSARKQDPLPIARRLWARQFMVEHAEVFTMFKAAFPTHEYNSDDEVWCALAPVNADEIDAWEAAHLQARREAHAQAGKVGDIFTASDGSQWQHTDTAASPGDREMPMGDTWHCIFNPRGARPDRDFNEIDLIDWVIVNFPLPKELV